MRQDHAPVVAPPPLIDVGWFAAGLMLERVLPLPRPGVRKLGVPLMVGGGLLAGWAIRTMTRAGTTISPYEKSAGLVTDGPFQYTRNPIYLGGTLLYAGLALIVDRMWPVLLLPAVLATLQRGVIEREEAYLEGRFGAAYEQYRGRVPRWLPGV